MQTLEAAQGVRDRADRAHGVGEHPGIGRVAANGERDLAQTEEIEHIKLPRGEGKLLGLIRRLDVQSHGVVDLARNAPDAEPARRHGLDARGPGRRPVTREFRRHPAIAAAWPEAAAR